VVELKRNMWWKEYVEGICGRNKWWKEYVVEGICGRNKWWKEYVVEGICGGRNMWKEYVEELGRNKSLPISFSLLCVERILKCPREFARVRSFVIIGTVSDH